MFCDRCGAQVGANQEFCHGCGKRLLLPTAAAGTAPVPARDNMAHHFRTLGILWLVLSAFRMIPGAALFFSSRFIEPFGPGRWDHDFPFNPHFFVPHLLTGIGSVLMVSALLGFLAGYGLLERRPWARTLAIVLAIFGLVDFPFGTALGIYTLWALFSPRAEQEYRQADI